MRYKIGTSTERIRVKTVINISELSADGLWWRINCNPRDFIQCGDPKLWLLLDNDPWINRSKGGTVLENWSSGCQSTAVTSRPDVGLCLSQLDGRMLRSSKVLRTREIWLKDAADVNYPVLEEVQTILALSLYPLEHWKQLKIHKKLEKQQWWSFTSFHVNTYTETTRMKWQRTLEDGRGR